MNRFVWSYLLKATFTSDIADKMSTITRTNIYLFFNKLNIGYVCNLESINEENITKSILFDCLESNYKKDFLSMFIKNTKITTKSGSLSFKRLSGVDFK